MNQEQTSIFKSKSVPSLKPLSARVNIKFLLEKLEIADKLEELNTNKRFVDNLLHGNKAKSDNLKK
jgi:hypothetical protein